VQAGNLIVFVRSELRLSHYCWSATGALWLSSRRRASGDRTVWPQRTEDYQRFGYENHPTHALPGSDGTRASLAVHQRLQEPLRAWDRAPLVYVQNFHPEGIRRGTAAGLPRGPYQRKISNLHLRTSLPTGLYASLRPKGGAVARCGRSPSGIEYYATVDLRSL
jgi:hypothetical protein